MRLPDYISFSGFLGAIPIWTGALLLQSLTILFGNPVLRGSISICALALVIWGFIHYTTDRQTVASRAYRKEHRGRSTAAGAANLIPKVGGLDALLFPLKLALWAYPLFLLVLVPGVALGLSGLRRAPSGLAILDLGYAALAIVFVALLSCWVWYHQRRRFWAIVRHLKRWGFTPEGEKRLEQFVNDPFSRHLLLMAARFNDLQTATEAFEVWDEAHLQALAALGNQFAPSVRPFLQKLREHEATTGVPIIKSVGQFARGPEATPYDRMMFYAAAREHYEPTVLDLEP